MDKAYSPKQFERDIYARWEKSGFFSPEKLPGDRSEAFSVCMPPPNVTGVLHLGHALENSLMDVKVRYERMNGKRTLLVPGTDHAAVATQARVEKNLIDSGKHKNPRKELGRAGLLKEIRSFAEESKDTIINQIKRMGTSCDWDRLAYTFDEDRSRVVNDVFMRMYNDGLIYRGDRIVNWDSKLQTTVSDDELVWEDEKTKFYYFKYGPFTIGTARPETKFGDKYVVMHPDDDRYKEYQHGQEIEVEWITGKITATIIKDEAANPEFGTGVMTITPWHDVTDFEIAERHNLDKQQIIDTDGNLLEIAGDLAGMSIFEARGKIVEILDSKGLLEKVDENYEHRIARSDRGQVIIEPQIKTQWFVDVNKEIPGKGKSLKDLMKEAVETGHNGDKNQKVTIVPGRFEKNYYGWIDNLRDWNISRQIWWGHRIPVWYRTFKPQKNLYKMGFHGRTVDSVISKGKYKTYRTREHEVEVGEQFALLNSQEHDEIFGYGTIIGIKKTTAGECPIDDTAHGVIYEKQEDLIEALQFHRPEEKITKNTPVWIYTYSFGTETNGVASEQLVGKCPPQDNTNFVFLHGFYRTREVKDPLKWLNEQISRADNFWDILPNPDKPDLDEQMEFVMENAHIHKDSVIVTHSLGGVLALKMIEKHGLKIKKLVLISTPQKVNLEELESYNPGDKFDFDKVKSLVGEIVMFRAQEDHILTAQEQENLGKELDARMCVIQNTASHFNSEQSQDVLRELQKSIWTQDEDTLDTWFSSGMWTFSTLQGDDFKTFHPTSWMQMGYEILFFWMARMILMSTYTHNQIPFKEVYIHGMLRDKDNQKFSKSLGNGIDPIEVGEQHGTDALRIALLAGMSPGNDGRFYEEKVEQYRNLVNKIWNISRFIRTVVGETKTGEPILSTATDHWMASRLAEATQFVRKDIEADRYSQAIDTLYTLTWHDFADWYIEVSKVEGDKDALLVYFLRNILALWHPFAPFVTEAIWHEFGFDSESMLIVSDYPKKSLEFDTKKADEFGQTQELIVALRAFRTDYRIDIAQKLNISVDSKEFQSHEATIQKLARIDAIEYSLNPDHVKLVVGSDEVGVGAKDVIDIDKESKRLQEEIAQTQSYIKATADQLKNKGFVDNAPSEVVEQKKTSLKEAEEKLQKLQSLHSQLS